MICIEKSSVMREIFPNKNSKGHAETYAFLIVMIELDNIPH